MPVTRVPREKYMRYKIGLSLCSGKHEILSETGKQETCFQSIVENIKTLCTRKPEKLVLENPNPCSSTVLGNVNFNKKTSLVSVVGNDKFAL
jgi:hypothetical protein